MTKLDLVVRELAWKVCPEAARLFQKLAELPDKVTATQNELRRRCREFREDIQRQETIHGRLTERLQQAYDRIVTLEASVRVIAARLERDSDG